MDFQKDENISKRVSGLYYFIKKKRSVLNLPPCSIIASLSSSRYISKWKSLEIIFLDPISRFGVKMFHAH